MGELTAGGEVQLGFPAMLFYPGSGGLVPTHKCWPRDQGQGSSSTKGNPSN
jgi:hypothetical protein